MSVWLPVSGNILEEETERMEEQEDWQWDGVEGWLLSFGHDMAVVQVNS